MLVAAVTEREARDRGVRHLKLCVQSSPALPPPQAVPDPHQAVFLHSSDSGGVILSVTVSNDKQPTTHTHIIVVTEVKLYIWASC
jgi:hypothetical protein